MGSASEDDLPNLGLTEKGDVLTLKSFFFFWNNEASDELANLIKSTEADRIPRKKAKVTYVRHEISFSWMESIRQGF